MYYEEFDRALSHLAGLANGDTPTVTSKNGTELVSCIYNLGQKKPVVVYSPKASPENDTGMSNSGFPQYSVFFLNGELIIHEITESGHCCFAMDSEDNISFVNYDHSRTEVTRDEQQRVLDFLPQIALSAMSLLTAQ